VTSPAIPCPPVNASIHKISSIETLVALLAAFSLLIAARPAAAVIDAALQMQLGNPSGATADPGNHNHYLIQRPIEAIDYSDNLGQPNWASWDLTASDLGSSGRTDAWAPDSSLPPAFYQVPINAYSGSGYDRGHLCPSGDRTVSVPTNELTFIMSNMMPQASLQNQNIWATFENYCRQTLLSGNKELLIICGPGGFGTNRLSSNSHVTIPAYTWKIVVVVPPGAGTATNRITPTTQVLALKMPNTDAVGSDPWQDYVTNAVAIEQATGLTFFTALPPNLATVLRNKVNGQTPPAPAITGFTPTAGSGNTSVVIAGTNFVFATNVTFNGTSAAFTINSTAQITATVPAGAATGPIQVMTLGGTATSSGNFTVSTVTAPDLALTVTHTGNFTQGDLGQTYTLVVTNLGTGTGSGTVTVTNILPAGLTATAIGGPGWTANLGTLTCTRSDALAGGAAYPPITLTVNVDSNAPASVTNVAIVSGGGDIVPANNAASDPTTINPATTPTAITGAASAVGTSAATLNGTVNPNGLPATVQFEYGATAGYGSVAAVGGTLTGTVAQPVSVSLTGLLAGTTYHFRIAATNLLGAGTGQDQTFATAIPGSSDLTIAMSHSGSLAQGGSGSYVLIVTNIGTAPSSGTVTVMNTLPAGLTATAIGGAGWTVDLGTLTCTRSDALSAGASYAPITISVSVATNAPASVTNTASVSGGGDGNTANNTAADPTTIIPTSTGSGVTTLVGWDVSALPGGPNNFGPSPMPPTTNANNLTIVGLARGPGVGSNATQAAARAWGGNTWTDTTSDAAIAAGRLATFSVAANSGYRISFASISKFDYRRSSTGPAYGLLQYQVGAGAFADAAALSYPSNTSSGASLPPIDLSGIASLQNVGPGTNVTFRIVNWGGTSSAGTWYIFDVANSTVPDFVVQGTVSPAVIPAPDLAIGLTHAGSFTQGDPSRTYTITVTNNGTAATAGAAHVADTLPFGLTAISLSGSGWTTDLDTLTCTRSDALAPGVGYPPITLTVAVATNAPTSVTNTATVSGGGEGNFANNMVSDPTSIIALAPIQLWRLQWYGTTANAGPAADTFLAPSGMPNLLAYALGLNPMVPTNNPVIGNIDTGHLRLTLPRNPAATDISYYAEIANNLTTPAWTTNGITVDISTPTLLQAHETAPVASSLQGFIRLRVTRP
jgi:uncharacterized repeat protein (TIGR01451 family)